MTITNITKNEINIDAIAIRDTRRLGFANKDKSNEIIPKMTAKTGKNKDFIKLSPLN